MATFFEFGISFWALAMLSGIPLLLVLIASVVILRVRTPQGASPHALLPLRLIAIIAAATWLMLAGETLSTHRMPLFDLGAPLMLVVSLLALPVLAVLAWRTRSTLAAVPQRKALFVSACVLIALTLFPGLLLIAFYAIAMRGGAWLS